MQTAAQTVGQENAKAWLGSIVEMLDALNTARNNYNDTRGSSEAIESAEQTIRESVLSVVVRDGWHAPGAPSEDGAEEYEILLSIGEPALRICGRLGKYGEPDSAELQHQDGGTPWTRYPAPEATLLAFARWSDILADLQEMGVWKPMQP